MDILKLFLLDVVDVVPAKSGNGLDYTFYLLVAVTILAEAGVMRLMKYNDFSRSLLHSFVANLASLAAGFLLIKVLPDLFSATTIVNLLALMLITIAVELPVLYLFNKTKPFRSTLTVCVVMNIASYILFYLYINIFAR